MAHLCTFSVFMFCALKSDFHLCLRSLVPLLHLRCRPGIVAAIKPSADRLRGMRTESAPGQLDWATLRKITLPSGEGAGQQALSWGHIACKLILRPGQASK